jgi:hypothetical protein
MQPGRPKKRKKVREQRNTEEDARTIDDMPMQLFGFWDRQARWPDFGEVVLHYKSSLEIVLEPHEASVRPCPSPQGKP